MSKFHLDIYKNLASCGNLVNDEDEDMDEAEAEEFLLQQETAMDKCVLKMIQVKILIEEKEKEKELD